MKEVYVLMQNDIPIGVVNTEKGANEASKKNKEKFLKDNPHFNGPAYFYHRGPFTLSEIDRT